MKADLHMHSTYSDGLFKPEDLFKKGIVYIPDTLINSGGVIGLTKDYLKRDKDLESADYVFNLAHKFQIDKMSSDKIYPTWVFGTSQDDNIISIINDNILKNTNIN